MFANILNKQCLNGFTKELWVQTFSMAFNFQKKSKLSVIVSGYTHGLCPTVEFLTKTSGPCAN